MGGIGNIYIKPGCKVLYLGAASGTTVSHVSDIVGQVITLVHFGLVCSEVDQLERLVKLDVYCFF